MIKVDYDEDFMNDSDLVGVGARNFIIIIMVFDRVFFFNDDDDHDHGRLFGCMMHPPESRWCLGR